MQTHTHTFTLWPNESSLKTHFSHWTGWGGVVTGWTQEKEREKGGRKGEGEWTAWWWWWLEQGVGVGGGVYGGGLAFQSFSEATIVFVRDLPPFLLT